MTSNKEKDSVIIDYNSKDNQAFRIWISCYKYFGILLFLAGISLLIADNFIYVASGTDWWLWSGVILLLFPLMTHIIFLVIYTVRERGWFGNSLDDQPFHGKFLKEDDFDTTVDFPI